MANFKLVVTVGYPIGCVLSVFFSVLTISIIASMKRKNGVAQVIFCVSVCNIVWALGIFGVWYLGYLAYEAHRISLEYYNQYYVTSAMFVSGFAAVYSSLLITFLTTLLVTHLIYNVSIFSPGTSIFLFIKPTPNFA